MSQILHEAHSILAANPNETPLWGSKDSSTGQREKVNRSAVGTEASVGPVVAEGWDAFSEFPKLRRRTRLHLLP